MCPLNPLVNIPDFQVYIYIYIYIYYHIQTRNPEVQSFFDKMGNGTSYLLSNC